MESSDAPATEPEDVLSPPSTEGVLCPPVPHSTPNEVYSLVFVLEEGKVLLGKKKNGYGKDSWNGLSGKVHTEERVEEGAVRTMQECGLEVNNLDKAGVVILELVWQPQFIELHIFRTKSYCGTPVETEEAKPQWFAYADIPFDSMWPDTYRWYPHLLSGLYFDAYFLFESQDEVVKAEVVHRKPPEKS